MANLKEVRNRITSVSSTRQITAAMKMVSAAALRRAQDAIVQIRPYATKLHEILLHLSNSVENMESNPYTRNGKPEKVLFVLISSNRGLCGAFNANVVKTTYNYINTNLNTDTENQKIDFFLIGKKANDILKSKNVNIVGIRTDLTDKPTYEQVSVLSEQIMTQFVDKKYDRIMLVYNAFKNAGMQILTAEQFLPIQIETLEHSGFNLDYIFEPSKEEIVTTLIPKSLKIQFYKAILDSIASEHGARMTAMHKATDNATEMIKDLKLIYNKARQASITKEILEIVAGAEALKN